VYFYVNSKKASSAELSKYASLKGRLLLDLKEGLNEFLISGLDIEKTLSIYVPVETITSESIDVESQSGPKKQFFNISRFELNKNVAGIGLDSNIGNLTGTCYILDVRTSVSEEYNISYGFNFTLNINNSLLKEPDKIENHLLKLTCKYKKAHLKT